ILPRMRVRCFLRPTHRLLAKSRANIFHPWISSLSHFEIVYACDPSFGSQRPRRSFLIARHAITDRNHSIERFPFSDAMREFAVFPDVLGVPTINHRAERKMRRKRDVSQSCREPRRPPKEKRIFRQKICQKTLLIYRASVSVVRRRSEDTTLPLRRRVF